MSDSRVHLKIYGRVQGVSFRYYARRQAASLGLVGWVRNCPDGSVEAVAEGEETAVQEFVSWAHSGPSGAHVERLECDRGGPPVEEHTFRIIG
jgi:acylphosphatase